MSAIHSLRKSFGSNLVLDGITLEVTQGEVVCVIGASGSGKSTLLRCVNGLESYDSGEIVVAGAWCHVKCEPRGASIGRARVLVLRVGLAGKENDYPHRLSGGQQQRVAIARALAMRPQAILFDDTPPGADPRC